jgi:tetratricopeptide (TPR) repeat protein
LERSAGRAQARGGVAAAAAFLQRSVALTLDPARRAERALAAAEASLQAGAFDAALGLLATAEAGVLNEFQRARVDLVRGHVVVNSGNPGEGSQLLLKAARQFEPFNMELARETYLTAWGAASLATQHLAGGGGDVLLEVCRTVQSLPPPPDDPHPLALLLDGLALLTTDGRAAAAPTLQRAAKALTDIPADDVLRWGFVATAACNLMWDHESYLATCKRQIQFVRDAGALAQLPLFLAQAAIARLWIGDLAGAASFVAESDTVAAATGSHFSPYALLWLRALQGRETEAAAVIASAIEQTATGTHAMAHAHQAAAVLYNGLARYEEAASSARIAADSFDPWYSMWALPELVEAATRTGDAELARDALERLGETTQPAGTDFALGIEARSRALVSDNATADPLYREAIDRLGRTRLRPELARAQLLYGEWLRREGRRIDAREQLRTAHDLPRFKGSLQHRLLLTGWTVAR